MTQDTQAGAGAGAHPAPAQQPKTLRELAEVVRDWGKRDHAWAHPDPDCFDVALFGHISEDGEPYPVAEVNADTYGHEGVSLQLAQFYAAASPAAVLALLDRVELRDTELKAARADAKHWRTNHDNVVARLRIFTQRPDIPKELADRLPWYRELVRLQEVEAQALPSVVVGPLAERGILDAIRSAYDLGYNDARSARAVPGDSAPGYKGRQVEGDHGGALVHLLKKLQAAPPAPAAVAVPFRQLLTGQVFRFAPDGPTFKRDKMFFVTMPTDGHNGRAMPADLDALVYPVPALAAAPAQAVAVPATWVNPVSELLGHISDVLPDSAFDKIDTAKWNAVSALVGAAATPAQEHATQLAGQDGEQDEGLAQAIDERDTAEGWADGLAGLIGAYFGQDIGEHSSAHNPWQEAKDIIEEAEPYRSAAAAPAQAQEDARDALTLDELDQLDRAIEHFWEGEDTDVDCRLLTRAASLGYLECERFTVPPTARAAIDAARAAQGGS